MNNTSSSPPNPPATPSSLTETLTLILSKTTDPTSSISKFIHYLTPTIIHSIIQSKTLRSHPLILLHFFKFSLIHAPHFSIGSPTTRPSFSTLLQTLFAHNRYSDAKTLLVNFIADTRHLLLRRILHPAHDMPRHSKALYDTTIGGYAQIGNPSFAMIVFGRMERLRICPKLITCNTLINSLI
ncbi:putative tetratricopeptide-like helical domain superfamily [Helianthus annuus]|nr:putative tetratricopeptide-like helical domain superfamily [Helianthus annuus]